MTVQEELRYILAEVKAWRWTPELFGRVNNLLDYADVFNILRKELTPEEYAQFDLEYRSHYRPQDRELIKWLREEQRKEDAEKWKTMSRRDLQKLTDEQLLNLLLKLNEEKKL